MRKCWMYLPSKFILSLIFLSSFSCLSNSLNGQSWIKGQVFLDSSWTPVAYLSEIPDFPKMNKMSDKMIIDQADINLDGIYEFKLDFLATEDRLYRIHFSKAEDPAASLVIGGRSENHFFFFANNQSQIEIYSGLGEDVINNLHFSGFEANDLLQELMVILQQINSTNQIITAAKRELALKTGYENLRGFADSCSHPLVALYAIYHSDFEEDIFLNRTYYKQFLKDWKNEDSSYFEIYRRQISTNRPMGLIFFTILLVTLLFFLYSYWVKKQKQNRRNSILQSLSIQERKIYNLLVNGRSNKEISEDCFIGINTVKTHIYNIYSKLEVGSRKELINRYPKHFPLA